jgi:hypothetical protein
MVASPTAPEGAMGAGTSCAPFTSVENVRVVAKAGAARKLTATALAARREVNFIIIIIPV